MWILLNNFPVKTNTLVVRPVIKHITRSGETVFVFWYYPNGDERPKLSKPYKTYEEAQIKFEELLLLVNRIEASLPKIEI